MYCPFEDFEVRHPDWVIKWRYLEDRLGLTRFEEKTVYLHPDQNQAQLRSTMTHERFHVDRGPGPHPEADPPSYTEEDEERIVEQLAARKLVRIRELADALSWSPHLDEVAAELHVDVSIVTAWLDNVRHPGEAAYLRSRGLGAHLDARPLGRGVLLGRAIS